MIIKEKKNKTKENKDRNKYYTSKQHRKKTKYRLLQLFYVGPDRFVVHDVFPSVFGGSIVTIKMGMEHTL